MQLCSGKRREQRGVVDQNVDLAEPLHRLGDQRLHRAFVADIGDAACHRIGAVRARQFRGELLAVGNVGDHQARALGGERARIVHADAFGAAGEDRHAAVETRHHFLLLSRTPFGPIAQLLPPCAAMNFAKAVELLLDETDRLLVFDLAGLVVECAPKHCR